MKNRIGSLIFAAIVLAVFALTANSWAFGQKPQSNGELRSAGRAVARGGGANALRGVVSPANRQTFQVGKNFAMAIDDAKYMGIEDDMFNYAVVDLVYLIDSLEGQPEAQQLQAILKGIVRDTKDLALVSGEIATISKSYLARQTTEKKWYFNVGSAQMNLLLAGWGKDGAGSVASVKELQTLARTAPQGTPQIVLDAIRGLSKYAARVSLTEADFTALTTDTKIITTLVYA